MPRKITDEFSDLPVSHQRKSQLRNRRDGKCILCGEPRATALHCLKHALAVRARRQRQHGPTRPTNSLTDRLQAPVIQDEFTALPVSERKKTELRRRRDGLCVLCGQPVVTKVYCLAHAEANREQYRKLNPNARRNLNARSYRAVPPSR
jgi:hypothetical protein